MSESLSGSLRQRLDARAAFQRGRRFHAPSLVRFPRLSLSGKRDCSYSKLITLTHVYVRISKFTPSLASKCKAAKILISKFQLSSKVEKNIYTKTMSSCQMLAKHFVKSRLGVSVELCIHKASLLVARVKFEPEPCQVN